MLKIHPGGYYAWRLNPESLRAKEDRRLLPAHLRRLALPGGGDRSVFTPGHRLVHEFAHRQRIGDERVIDGGVASKTGDRSPGAFRSRKSVQQLRLA